MRYETEIHVSGDRYVCLQLPSYFPEGKATVVVRVDLEHGPTSGHPSGDDADRQDIEWWDEFDEEVGQVP